MTDNEDTIKLVIADDHTLFRDALIEYIKRSNLNAELVVLKSFDEAYEYLETDNEQDLVILDLRMPGMNGLQGFKTLKEKYPEIRVALMSGVAEEAQVREAFENGVVGYFPKTMTGKALLQAIKLVLLGERFLPLDHKENTIMPSYFTDPDLNAPREYKDTESFDLTPRECDVLSYLVSGASNKEIANALGLQVVTIKLHVRGICRKLDAQNRTQAALIAKEHKLVKEAR
tara:strand:+ start:18434 stop:19123 length:690 start_codon:yes stop_codon:yes gene_type:complete